MKIALSCLLLSFLWETQSSPPIESLEAIIDRAKKILEQNQGLEITTSEARRRVEQLLKDLQAWAEKNQVTLEERKRQFNVSLTEGKALTTSECPIFFGEDREELCPNDQARSEVWGGQVLHCRYLCPSPQ